MNFLYCFFFLSLNSIETWNFKYQNEIDINLFSYINDDTFAKGDNSIRLVGQHGVGIAKINVLPLLWHCEDLSTYYESLDPWPKTDWHWLEHLGKFVINLNRVNMWTVLTWNFVHHGTQLKEIYVWRKRHLMKSWPITANGRETVDNNVISWYRM